MRYLVDGLRICFMIVIELFTIKQFYHLAMANTKAGYIVGTVVVMIYLFMFCWFFVLTVKKTYKDKKTNTMEEKNESKCNPKL